MKRAIRAIVLILCLGTGSLRAEGPEGLYLNVYSLIQEGDALNETGQARLAMAKYAEAQSALARFPTTYPGWNENLIRFRLNYVNSKLAPLLALMPPSTNAAAPGAHPLAEAVPAGETNSLVRQLQEEMRRLHADNQNLAARLKEALSVQPSATDPRELTRVQEKSRELLKENELLKVTLKAEQERSAKLVEPTLLADATRSLTETQSRLLAQEQTLTALRTENEMLKKQSTAAGSTGEGNARLDRQLEKAQRDLAALQSQHEKLQADKKFMETRVKELESSLLQANSTAAERAQTEARKLKQAQDELGRQIEQAQKAAGENRDQIAKLEKERDKLARDKAELETRLARKARAGGENAADAQEAKRLKEELARQGESAKAALKESQSRADRFEKELAALTKAKFELEERLNKGLASASAPADARKVKKLEEEMARQSAEAREAQARVAALEKEAAALTKAKIDLEKQAASAGADATKAEAKRRKELEEQIADLQSKLEKTETQLARRSLSRGASAQLQQQVDTLQARLKVLESKPEPFTAEELAVLKAPAGRLVASAAQTGPAVSATTGGTTNPAAKPPRAKRTAAQLPPGAGAMDAAAQRDFIAGRFEEAEKKYLEILRQDEKNVFVLGNLASTQIELSKFDEADKHLTTALTVDPEDDYCLYLKGRVLYQRGKLDEALDHLSRAAQASPDSAEIQNYLGIVLVEKGLRSQAEAAFRKAIQILPGYGAAHKNLAFVYATQKPPSLALARWHYQKAREAGVRNADIEKLLGQ